MAWLLTIACSLGLFLSVPTFSKSPISCPDPSLSETAEDCPWGGMARELEREADAGNLLTLTLEQLRPGMIGELNSLRALNGLKSLWGTSINYDELAKGTIVHPAILDLLLRETNGPARSDRYAHAGIEHTYGYLFSTLQTPFGYKRARWVRGEVEKGFGLANGLLSPSTSEGTLFTNATFLAGAIALQDDPRSLALLLEASPAVAGSIRGYEFGDLESTRLEEKLKMGDRTVALRTDFVTFPNTVPNSNNTHWLIYSVSDSQATHAVLITAFPVETSFVERALNPKDLGDNKPISTRYNAFVDGVTNSSTPLKGSRKVIPHELESAPRD